MRRNLEPNRAIHRQQAPRQEALKPPWSHAELREAPQIKHGSQGLGQWARRLQNLPERPHTPHYEQRLNIHQARLPAKPRTLTEVMAYRLYRSPQPSVKVDQSCAFGPRSKVKWISYPYTGPTDDPWRSRKRRDGIRHRRAHRHDDRQPERPHQAVGAAGSTPRRLPHD